MKKTIKRTEIVRCISSAADYLKMVNENIDKNNTDEEDVDDVIEFVIVMLERVQEDILKLRKRTEAA